MTKIANKTPNMMTAELIQAYAQRIVTECMGDGDAGAYDHLLEAILKTDATDAGACCYMGRAMLEIEESLSDPPYRLDGAMCDPERLKLAHLLGVTTD
jgi:hypothetical protein